jgi:hypothetical protein
VIKLGNKYYKPVSNKDLQEVIIGTATFVPVDHSEAVYDAIPPTYDYKKANGFKVQSQSYIPLKSIPS